MKLEKRIQLEKCVSERLELLSKRLNLMPHVAEYEYLHRLNNLTEVNRYQLNSVESKLIVRAYEGTVRYYEGKV